MKQELSLTKNSRPELFWKKSVLDNFAKFTGKHPCQSLLLDRDLYYDYVIHHEREPLLLTFRHLSILIFKAKVNPFLPLFLMIVICFKTSTS